ncbi:uncharacterized protein BDZ83DRAFT_627633 [Colletotrichum acutatum]|uniref:Uncharacterized protein n=1 Tax=Glomerella acutata TaxID=27357 RepID=A0AAD8UGV2_GLOAC|nr:uncharacterized protein BDZ83DRAFT_627633 [Colletotrichum acutatum]KAK1722913.1 hypothetical protein BDZ83DRAFT_627633 [Colletotrichum acutatum]
MAPPWPQEQLWPTHHREHAAELSRHLQTAVESIDTANAHRKWTPPQPADCEDHAHCDPLPNRQDAEPARTRTPSPGHRKSTCGNQNSQSEYHPRNENYQDCHVAEHGRTQGKLQYNACGQRSHQRRLESQ